MTLKELSARMYLYKAVCLNVVDGDTVDVDIDLGCTVHTHQRVRLYGINTPEIGAHAKDAAEKTAGMKARDRVKELLLGTKPPDLYIQTFKDSSDKYGRLLATIWIVNDVQAGGIVCLNEELVSEGLAVAKKY